MSNTQKTDIVSSVIESLQASKNFALVQFEKTTHKSLEGLRAELRTSDAQMKVIKNTLFEKAVNKLSEDEKGYQEIRSSFFPLREKSALITFTGDWATGLKAYFNAAKANEAFSFKFGMIENMAYDSEGMTKLAQLPAKHQLVAQLLGAMMNPIVRTTRAMKNPMQKLVFVLNAKAQEN